MASIPEEIVLERYQGAGFDWTRLSGNSTDNRAHDEDDSVACRREQIVRASKTMGRLASLKQIYLQNNRLEKLSVV